jgi:hypothetical protein
MMPIPRPTPIYRLIHLDNLSVCLERGGMYAPNHTPKDGRVYRTIHDIEIQQVRRARPIRCGAGGTVHDYVAFYFGPRSPMLLKLKTGQVEGYMEGQDPLIYLLSTVEAIHQDRLDFVFSDGHGIAAFTQWFDDLGALNQVDWDMVYADYWADTVADMDRQRRKQAEFLVYRFCPWEVIARIGVINGGIKVQVESILAKYGIQTPVDICRQWYY